MPDTQLNGDSDSRLPHLANIPFKYINSSQLLASLKPSPYQPDRHVPQVPTSHHFVLKAMGIENDMAKAALRFSLGGLLPQKKLILQFLRFNGLFLS